MHIDRSVISPGRKTGAGHTQWYIRYTPLEEARCRTLGIHGYLGGPLDGKTAQAVLDYFEGRKPRVKLIIKKPGEMEPKKNRQAEDNQPRRRRRHQ